MKQDYEAELKKNNPRLRKDLGVYYTPESAINFIIESLIWILFEKFNVKIQTNLEKCVFFDPAMGSGNFIFELIKSLTTQKIPSKIFPQIVGTELDQTALTHARERINSLISQSSELSSNSLNLEFKLKDTLQLPDMEFKGQTLVIFGNPPYSRDSAQNKSPWIQELMQKYRENLNEKNIQPLNDDYVKFIRYAESHLEKMSQCIIAFVTPHGFLDGIIFRQMRKSLCQNCTEIYILNLHGNRNRKETTHLGYPDENIFPEIKQGISISFFIKGSPLNNACNSNESCPVHYLDIYGTREAKFSFLNSNHVGIISNWTQINPISPYYWFVPRDNNLESVYSTWWGIDEIFAKIEVGVGTYRDNMAVAFTKNQLKDRLQYLQNMVFDSKECKKYGIKTKIQLEQFQKIIQQSNPDRDWQIYNYRPFDQRIVLYLREIVARGRWSRKIMPSMLSPNLALVITKLCNDMHYSHVFVSESLIDKGLLSDTTSTSAYLCPLFIYNNQEKSMNFTEKFVKFLHQIHYEGTPESILGYIYCILNQNNYRAKYYDSLRTGFPRIPFSTDVNKIKNLAEMGWELITLHLSRNAQKSENNLPIFGGYGSNLIESIKFVNNKLFINKDQYFSPISDEIWNFQLGGYTPIPMWLKYRKKQIITSDDIKYFCNLLVIIQQTIEIQKKIEKLIESVVV